MAIVVDVPTEVLQNGELPRVCLMTGETGGVELRPTRLTHEQLDLLYLMFGMLEKDTRHVDAQLPLSEAGLATRRAVQTLRMTLIVIGALLMFAAFVLIIVDILNQRAFSGWTGVGLGLAAFVVGGAICCVAEVVVRRQGPCLVGVDERSVRLSIPNEEAALAVEEELARRFELEPAVEEEPPPPPPLPADQVPEHCPQCGGRLIEPGEEPEPLGFCFHCGASLSQT